MFRLPYRQVHLDFHTAPQIENVGALFDKKAFSKTLKEAHVASVTVFAKCHHGYSYHPARENEMHPHLQFDLLGAQLESLEEAGIRACVYISAGFDERQALQHPEWWARDGKGRSRSVPDENAAGFHLLCFNTPYLDLLERQAAEVAARYPCAGFFFDISNVVMCRCEKCRRDMAARGLDADNDGHLKLFQEEVYLSYAARMERAVHRFQPNATIFHNAGHVPKGNAKIYGVQSHFEMESLPTGGWGYDHFPMSALWAATTGREYSGMTGKFHFRWGEFGGYKHPNALLYETALCAALGARCSIGDQLPPSGKLDAETYRLIGGAYEKIELIENELDGAVPCADIGVLSYEGMLKDVFEPFGETRTLCDVGCVRLLLEEHQLFHVIDEDSDFSAYRLLILPDKIRAAGALAEKLRNYVRAGGKILATGRSLLNERDEFIFPLGAKFCKKENFRPLYVRTEGLLSRSPTDYVFYAQAYKTEGKGEGGTLVYPAFERTKEHFCSHLHAPPSEHTGGSLVYYNEERSVAYLPVDLFEEYATAGSYICRQIFSFVMDSLLEKSVKTDLPSQGVVTLMRQRERGRDLLHLLYAAPVKRGNGVEVIEDIVELHEISVSLSINQRVKSIVLLPQRQPVSFIAEKGKVNFNVPALTCHQLVAVKYEREGEA